MPCRFGHGGDVLTAQTVSGGPVLDFSANLNPLGMPPEVSRAALEAACTQPGYPDPLCRALRAAIARGDGVGEEQVLCGNGAADLIFRLAYALRPRTALLTAPSFSEYAGALEQAGCANPDEAAEPTGRMTAAILKRCAVQPEQEHILERMGLFLGKILYWLDAAEDYDKDLEKGRYNVFLRMGLDRAAAIEQAALQCRLAAGEVARCYNLLELQLNRPILDNIIFLGLPAGIRRAGQPTKHEKHAAPV